MSNPTSAPKGPKVSPTRTIVSLVLLGVVGVLCIIELRAGLGNYLTGQAFKKNSVEGGFTDKSLAQVEELVSFGPKKEVVEDSGEIVTYRYQWYSLLRGLIGERSPEIYVVASGKENPKALSYYALEKGEEPPSNKPEPSPATFPGQAPRAPGGGGAPPAPGGGGGFGGMRPPADNPSPTPVTRPPADDSEPSKEAPAEGAAPAAPADGSAPPAGAPAAPAEGTAAPADAPATEAPKQ